MTQTIKQDRIEGICHVTFPGRVDGNAVRELFELSSEVMDERDPKLLVDFTGVPLVTSGAMGILVQIKKRFLSVGGQLHVVVADEQNRQAFELMKLDIVLNLFESTDAATSAFK
jgi:anti-anti-sigma factor